MRDIGVDVNKPEGDWDGSKNCPLQIPAKSLLLFLVHLSQEPCYAPPSLLV